LTLLPKLFVPVNDPSMGDPEAALRVEVYGCPPCKPPSTTATEEPFTSAKFTGTVTEINGALLLLKFLL